MFETLKYEVKDGIAYITVNRPEALNALNSKVLAELYDAFAEFDADEAARVAILTGEGRSFVAGADIVYKRHYRAFLDQLAFYGVGDVYIELGVVGHYEGLVEKALYAACEYR